MEEDVIAELERTKATEVPSGSTKSIAEPVKVAVPTGGGSPPSNIVAMPKRVDSICWPCILLGVGFLLVGVAYIWLNATERE